MNTLTITELKAKRDALDKRISNYPSLKRSAAVDKLCTYATAHDMTEDDLFPVLIDLDMHPHAFDDDREWRDPEYVPFPEFSYPDTFGYTFIEDLKEQRDELDAQIYAIRREAVQRARAFIREYRLTPKDIYPMPRPAK